MSTPAAPAECSISVPAATGPTPPASARTSPRSHVAARTSVSSVTAVPTIAPPTTHACTASTNARATTTSTPSDAAHSIAPGRVTHTTASNAARTPATSSDSSSQRIPAAQSTSRAAPTSASQQLDAPWPRPPNTAHHGRIADTPEERIARALQRRADQIAAIRNGIETATRPGKKTVEEAFADLVPLDQILPSPPEWLIHQLATHWMRPTTEPNQRGTPLRRHLNGSFSRGTELQMLCAMAGLPLLPSSGNNHVHMRRMMFAAVRSYALNNPAIFNDEPGRVWWEGDAPTTIPIMTEHIRAVTKRAVEEGAAEQYTTAARGIMHTDMHNDMHNAPTNQNESEVPPPYSPRVPKSPSVASDLSSHLGSDSDSEGEDELNLHIDPPSIGRLPPLTTLSGEEALRHSSVTPLLTTSGEIVRAKSSSPATRATPVGAAAAAAATAPRRQPGPPAFFLSDLSPSNSTSVSALLETDIGTRLPWLKSALEAAAGPPRRMKYTSDVKRRLITAAIATLEMLPYATKAQLEQINILNSLESILATDPIAVPPGHGIYSRNITAIAKKHWSKTMNPNDMEDIDMAVRAMRRAHHTASKSQQSRIIEVLTEIAQLAVTPAPPSDAVTATTATPAPAANTTHEAASSTAGPPTSPLQLHSANRYAALSTEKSNTADIDDHAAADGPQVSEVTPLAPHPPAPATLQARISPTRTRTGERSRIPSLLAVESIDSTLRQSEVIPNTLSLHLSPTSDQSAATGDCPWYTGGERPAAEPATPTGAAAVLTESNGTSTHEPLNVKYIPISGLHNQCFYNATARHFEVYPHELQPVINDTLKSVNDPVLLGHYGLIIEPDADAATISAAKEAYLTANSTINSAWGGTLEMMLLSHARDGAISFRVIDTARNRNTVYCTRKEDDPAIHTEIVLHHCHINGINRSDVVPNHWATFDYVMRDGSTRIAWDPRGDTETLRSRRMQLLRAAADQANAEQRVSVRDIMTSDQVDAIALDRNTNGPLAQSLRLPAPSHHNRGGRGGGRGRGGRGGRGGATANHTPALRSGPSWQASRPVDTSIQPRVPSRPPMRRHPAIGVTSPPRSGHHTHATSTAVRTAHNRTLHTQSRLHFGAATPTITSTTPSGSAPNSWKSRRANTHREIHGRPNQLYCQTASRLCEVYSQVASAATPDRSRQAQVATFLMDYTGRALFRGHKVGMQRKCAAMEELGARVLHELDSALSSPLPTTTNTTARQVIDLSSSAESTLGTTAAATAATGPIRPPLPHTAVVATHAATSTLLESTTDHDTESDTLGIESEMLKSIRKCNFILAQGGPHCIQRAARALSSAPLAPLINDTVEKLRVLHPPSTEPMASLPDTAVGIADIDPARLESVLRKRIHNGSAPGVSGTTGSHLLALWENATPAGRIGFQLLIRDICNGVFDGELRERLLACVLVPLKKKDNGVRPVAVAEVFVRCAAHYMMSLIEDDMPEFFPRIQFGVKFPGGSETAAQLTRAELAYAATKHADVIALKIDFKNAFNAMMRARVWAALCDHPRASPILKAFHWQYSGSSPLLVYDSGRLFAELRSSNGVRQGCPFAAFAFALAVQPLYEAALREAVDCNGFSIQDDLTIVGPAEQVMRAYDYLKQHAQTDLGLELVTAKCQVYLPPTITAQQEQSIGLLCSTRHLAYSRQMESLGVMFGPAASVIAHCNSAVDDSRYFFDCISHPSMHTQTASILLRYCAIPRMGYLARTTHPDLLFEPARRFDQMALAAQLTILQQTDESLTSLEPRTSDPEDSIRIQDPGDGDPPPGSQSTVTTQRISAVKKEQLVQRMQSPLSLGGLGVRPVERIRHAAYFASLMQILPYFARIHPELRDANLFHGTELYREVHECQQRLIESGADKQFEIGIDGVDATQPTIPTVLAAATSVPNIVAAATAASTAPLTTAAAAVVAEASPPSPTSRTSTTIYATRFPSPSKTLKQSIDEIWQRAVRSVQSSSTDSTIFSVIKLQHDLTRSIEAYQWMQLFNTCGRYQQATLTTLTLNPSTNAWLTALPLSSQPGYRMRDEQYRLAVRHRLGQLPFDDLRSHICTQCARRNIDSPSLLEDPDHAHSCAMQQGVSVKQRHDALKQVLAELARSCGYQVEVEPRFPPIIETRIDSTGQFVQHTHRTHEHGDLLLVRSNVRQLIDVTVVRPTTLTLLTRGSSTGGSHIVPLVAATQAEKHKHDKYDIECARHGWKLVPFALESLGAVGSEATRLLASMSSHSTDKSPEAFLQHAHRMLSIALQTGNATISSQGTADLLMHSIRRGGSDLPSTNELGRGPGRNQLRRAANATAATTGFDSIIHSDYRSARAGSRVSCGAVRGLRVASSQQQ